YNVHESNVKADELGIADLNYTTIDSAREAIDAIDGAIGKVSENRARLGAMQNKLHSTARNVGIQKENLIEARSRISDADVAAVTSELVRDNILQSAGISVLAQANSAPTQALKLL